MTTVHLPMMTNGHSQRQSGARTVILVGAGHAHLYVTAHAEALVAAGARVVHISPGKFWYSGLATGMLGGRYSAGEDQVDPRTLAEAYVPHPDYPP